MANLPRRTTSSNAVAPIIAATGALAGVGLALAWIAYSRTRIQHNLPLTAALDGDLQYVTSPSAGELAYYATGPNPRGKPPVLMIHSVNAAASSFEMKPLFDRLSKTRRVIALDLPGYGFSSRADREYTPALMRDAIVDFIRLVLKNGPVDVIALSLGAEFVALAAQAHPALFRTISFISPTGFGPRARSIKANPGMLRAMKLPLWRRPLFDLLTSRPSLRFFTQQSARKRMPRAFADYAYAASHQPGGENAPLAFLAGKLFTPRIFETYAALQQPSLLVYGNDPFADYDFVDELIAAKNWRIVPFPRAGALTHWDFPELVTQQVEKHIK